MLPEVGACSLINGLLEGALMSSCEHLADGRIISDDDEDTSDCDFLACCNTGVKVIVETSVGVETLPAVRGCFWAGACVCMFVLDV